MKPHRISMAHHLILGYGLHKHMEVYVSPTFLPFASQIRTFRLNDNIVQSNLSGALHTFYYLGESTENNNSVVIMHASAIMKETFSKKDVLLGFQIPHPSRSIASHIAPCKQMQLLVSLDELVLLRQILPVGVVHSL